MVVLYLILGIWLDGIPIVAMTLPVIYPVVKAMNIDPMWFAMVAIVACQMAGITPPLGNFVFGVKAVAEPDVSVEDIFFLLAAAFPLFRPEIYFDIQLPFLLYPLHPKARSYQYLSISMKIAGCPWPTCCGNRIRLIRWYALAFACLIRMPEPARWE